MDRKKMINLAMAVCAVIVVIAAAVTLRDAFSAGALSYADPGKYTAGEAELTQPVRALDIEWPAGNVALKYHSGNTVELRETADKALGEDMKLRWLLDGDTLRIRYAKNGIRLGPNTAKELTVTLPEGISFSEVAVRTASASVTIPDLKADSLVLQTASGDLRAAAQAKAISTSAASGSLELRLAGRAETVTASAASGSIHVEAEAVETLKGSSTSGSVQIRADRIRTCSAGTTSGAVTVSAGEADRVEVSSTSGSIDIALGKFSSLKANTTSGRLTAALPPEPGFTARIKTTSGRLDWDMNLSRDGDRYVCGDASAEAVLETTSGNILLKAFEP